MEKSYRELFEGLSIEAAGMPPLLDFVSRVGVIDDCDPMRVPALKAMRQGTAPPLELLYRLDDASSPVLCLYAQNPLRKRKAAEPSVCARLPLERWCVDAVSPFPGDVASRIKYLELVQRSFAYLELRIGIYFATRSRNALTLCLQGGARLRIEECATQEIEVLALPPGATDGIWCSASM
jgi:hypothetical protein